MQKDVYLKIIKRITDNPDDIAIALSELTELIETDSTEFENINTQVVGLTEKVAELRDSNMKLFLKTGQKIENQKPEEDKKPEDVSFDELFTDLVSEIEGGND